MGIGRAAQKGKPLDDDCKKAHISKNEYGHDDKRCFCYGLYAPNNIYEIHSKCLECGAYCRNAEPPNN